MHCPKCYLENDENALFCRHCGSPMKLEPKTKESNISSILIMIWVAATAFFQITQELLVHFVPDWYQTIPIVFIYTVIHIIELSANILPVFAIKNKPMKIVSLVIMSLLITWWVYGRIDWCIHMCKMGW